MQLSWLFRGVRTGILTTRYPATQERLPDGFRGRPAIAAGAAVVAGEELCPTGAIRADNSHGFLDVGRCIQCGLCSQADGIELRPAFELAQRRRSALIEPVGAAPSGGTEEPSVLDPAAGELQRMVQRLFSRSLHIRHVDAGSCNACESELKQLTSPYYDLHRLGLFFTTSPRHADLLLVTGPVTQAMEGPLRRTYEAMPDPKLVVAVGACACSGGLFAGGPLTHAGLEEVLPVDAFIPGCPPSPLALIQGLLVAIGRLDPRGSTA